jgi:hypothetical protein
MHCRRESALIRILVGAANDVNVPRGGDPPDPPGLAPLGPLYASLTSNLELAKRAIASIIRPFLGGDPSDPLARFARAFVCLIN